MAGGLGRFFARLRLWPTVAAVVALAVLIGLGSWQLQRLAWKRDIIDRLESRMAAPVIDLSLQGELARDDLPALEFRRMRVIGQYLPAAEMRLLSRTLRGRAGIHVITPFARAEGGAVLINRGWAPSEAVAFDTPAGTVVAEGFVRVYSEPGRFVPDNEPDRGLWYHMDAEQMARAAGLAELAPVYIVLTPVVDARSYPTAVPPVVGLRNDHLQYAATWYGLAGVLVVMFVVFHLRRGDD